MRIKEKEEKPVDTSSKERRGRSFEELLEEELDWLGSNESYIILRKKQNCRQGEKQINKQRRLGKNKTVDIPTTEKPLVLKTKYAGTTSSLIQKHERKGWVIEKSFFTEADKIAAAKDTRLNELIGHVTAVATYTERARKMIEQERGIKAKAKVE